MLPLTSRYRRGNLRMRETLSIIQITGTRELAQKWLSKYFYNWTDSQIYMHKSLSMNNLQAEPVDGFERITYNL